MNYANEDVEIIIVGNKSDLEKFVTNEEAQEKAEIWGVQYFSVSVQSFNEVNEVFESICKKIFESGYKIVKNEAVQLKPRLAFLYNENECC